MRLAKSRLQQHLSAQRYVGHPVADTSIGITVKLIAERFSAPMVQVNVLTADAQVTIAAVGGPLGVISRADSLCAQVVNNGQVTFLDDIESMPAQLAHIKAYLAVPLSGREGVVIGAVCLLDTVARNFGPADVQQLLLMARIVQDQLELSRRLRALSCGSTTRAAELATAIQDGQIVPFYQPIVDLSSGEIGLVEALARWRHPTRGLLTPDSFISLAEDSDIIIDLDLSILRQASVQLGRWRIRHPALRLGVNVSARHFDHPDCVDRLRQGVELVGTDPATVLLELTETLTPAADSGNQQALHSLRELGFGIVLDDFGSGFASMEQILALSLDGVKLDRTLTGAMGSPAGDVVVRHLIALAGDLGLSTVIEGIEHWHQADQARRDGGRYGQGHLWSPAIPAEQMTTFLARHRAVDRTP